MDYVFNFSTGLVEKRREEDTMGLGKNPKRCFSVAWLRFPLNDSVSPSSSFLSESFPLTFISFSSPFYHHSLAT